MQLREGKLQPALNPKDKFHWGWWERGSAAETCGLFVAIDWYLSPIPSTF